MLRSAAPLGILLDCRVRREVTRSRGALLAFHSAISGGLDRRGRGLRPLDLSGAHQGALEDTGTNREGQVIALARPVRARFRPRTRDELAAQEAHQ